MNEQKERKRKTVRAILIALCAVLVCVFVWSGYKILSTVLDYNKAGKTYNDIASNYASITATPAPTALPEGEGDPDQPAPTADPSFSPLRGSIDFAGLQESNSEYAAWIYSEGTPINYPIMFPKNDSEGNYYYIDHMPNGASSASGTLFMDYRNASDFSDQNTCIYGHNMKNGTMFATLHSYGETGYYEQHPVIYLSTPNANYRIDVIAGFVTEPTSFAYARNFDNVEQFQAQVQLYRELSDFDSEVEVADDDKLVTLSTCTYEVDDGRYVIVGKLINLDEAAA